MLDVVQEFTKWCGMEINVKKIFLLVIDTVAFRDIETGRYKLQAGIGPVSSLRV